MRPGREDSTTTRSASITDSGIEWVTNRTVLGCSRQMRISSQGQLLARVSASREPKGSSISRMSGSCTSARQMPVRICMPPDSSRGIFSLETFQADELQQAAGVSRACRRDTLHHLERKEHVVEARSPRAAASATETRCRSRRAARRPAGRRSSRVPWLTGSKAADVSRSSGRFPATGGADEADELVATDRDRDIAEGGDRSRSRETKCLKRSRSRSRELAHFSTSEVSIACL